MKANVIKRANRPIEVDDLKDLYIGSLVAVWQESEEEVSYYDLGEVGEIYEKSCYVDVDVDGEPAQMGDIELIGITTGVAEAIGCYIDRDLTADGEPYDWATLIVPSLFGDSVKVELVRDHSRLAYSLVRGDNDETRPIYLHQLQSIYRVISGRELPIDRNALAKAIHH